MKSLADLSAEIQSEITKDDLVEAIIYKSEQTKLPKSQAFLQQIFHRLQKEDPVLYSDFIFDESGITPFSDELDSVLFRLEASNVLHTLNPGYKNYIIEDSIEHLKKSYDKFRPNTENIDRSASLFSDLVGQKL